jgi:hypothetical protein
VSNSDAAERQPSSTIEGADMTGGESKRKCGNYTRRRGYEGEREWCKFLSDHGVKTERHFMSGMFVKGDCTTTPNCMDGTLKGQVKRKKKAPDWLELEGHDYVAVREDRGEWFVVIRGSLFRDLLQ